MITSFLAAWISGTNSTWGTDVDGRGVGYVVRNIAASIMTPSQARNHRRLRTIMPPVVEKKLDSRKKTIVLGDIIRIVGRDGRLLGNLW